MVAEQQRRYFPHWHTYTNTIWQDPFCLEVLIIAYRQFVSPLTFFNILLPLYPSCIPTSEPGWYHISPLVLTDNSQHDSQVGSFSTNASLVDWKVFTQGFPGKQRERPTAI